MSEPSRAVLVDGHVHFHDGFDPVAFFDHARDNFAAGAAALGLDPHSLGVLCFTESAGARAFQWFRGMALHGAAAGPWRFTLTGEPRSLLAQHERGANLLLVAGRQIVTREKLEVLAIGTDADVPDGQRIDTVVAAIHAAGAAAVVPWGFGKWWFRRGRRLQRFLASPEGERVFLGDNAGRLGAAPPPRLFRRAAARGHLILPGSDPLPFPAHATRAGSYGFVLADGLYGPRPAAELVQRLHALTAQPPTFGHLEGMAGFVAAQVGMQVRKHLRRAS